LLEPLFSRDLLTKTGARFCHQALERAAKGDGALVRYTRMVTSILPSEVQSDLASRRAGVVRTAPGLVLCSGVAWAAMR